MALILKSRFGVLTISGLFALCSVSVVVAAMDPRFEIDPQTLSAPAQSIKRDFRPSKSRTVKTTSVRNETHYTVKPGDHLFKILIQNYGLSNSEAESVIEEIKTENNISNIRRLKIGQKITIPAIYRRADGTLKPIQPLQATASKSSENETPGGQSFVLESPLSGQDALAGVRETWDDIMPVNAGPQKFLTLKTSAFSLTLDPQRYPTFSAMDGSRILVDQNDTIPPLVKSLIEEKDPTVHIVSNYSAGAKPFLSSMLNSAGFYSVENNFSMDFGSDPKLTVHADFKVEKTAESLIKQDLILMNAGHNALSPVLKSFLKKEGFLLYEPFATIKSYSVPDHGPIHIVAAKKQSEMVDSILSAFSVSADRDRSLDVYASDNNGISLSVKPERYFERSGHRYVVTSFDGDPVNYTLFRILETKGYRVIILEAQDDFRKVSEKIISRMKIQGSFAKHNLMQGDFGNYSLQMSGFKLNDASLPDGGLFLTNLAMDRIIRDLLTENGYTINGR